MTSQDLTLNIAVNLGRLARWVDEGKLSRVNLFLNETNQYVAELKSAKKNKRFEPTLNLFSQTFNKMSTEKKFDKDWAEEALTWANILTHRSKLLKE